MNLLIRNKFFSLRGSSVVTDDQDQPQFSVKGKLFSWTHKKIVCDMNGNKLYKVRNKFWNWFFNAALVYDAAGHKICKVQQRFGIFKGRFRIEGTGHDFKIEGDIIKRDFTIERDGVVIGEMHKRFISWTDAFELSCSNDAEAPFLVALIIAIDNIFDKNDRDRDRRIN